MTLDQMQAFIDQSTTCGTRWERIRLLGGEPALHPQLMEMLELLLGYRNTHNPDVEIEVSTNGAGPKVRRVLAQIPKQVSIRNSFKDAGIDPFAPFNMAPQDSLLYANADYTNGCSVLEDCGMGYTPLGYYPCAIAGGIDRIFGLGTGREDIPSSDDLMLDQLDTFCRLCGMFKASALTHGEKVSASWSRAYEAYERRKNAQ